MAYRKKIGFWRGCLVILVAATGLAGYWYFHPEQRPEFLVAHLPGSPDAVSKTYRWKDEAGNWVVSDQLPEHVTDYEVIEYRRGENVVPSSTE